MQMMCGWDSGCLISQRDYAGSSACVFTSHSVISHSTRQSNRMKHHSHSVLPFLRNTSVSQVSQRIGVARHAS